MSLVNEPPTTRYYDFAVEEAMGAPDGVEKLMLVVNGMYPGPTIEANVDDRIVVNERTNYYDGTDAITQWDPPGEWMVYNFTLTTGWEAHGGTPYTDGITGARKSSSSFTADRRSVRRYLSLDSTDERADVPGSVGSGGTRPERVRACIRRGPGHPDFRPVPRFSPELLEYYFIPGGIDGTPGNEPVPDGGTINGVGQYGSHNTSFFNFTLQPDTTYRLRIINPGTFVPLAFSVDGHTLTVIEGDGTPVEPVEVSSVSVAVAQRYSVLLRTNQTAGAYWMRAALDTTQFTYDNPGCQTEIRGVIRYGVDGDAMPDVALLDNPPAPRAARLESWTNRSRAR
ncbi:Cupredoxin [Fomitopsis serialis]|uniref:Cupredoxin n=1 Tax=Fomitopsis serialis TaxID=139415 RepID=UPI0020079115|nr:Cupredoxin [Neoantrodia serialis]KAH9934151.1 Cupredoxin [Neoantrodia serialis]